MKKHMHENSRLWDYQIIKQLGRGEYGQVFHVISKKDDNDYALKKVNLSNAHEKQKIQAFRQIKALKLIRHPDMVQYYESFLSLDNVYIVMEFAERGDFSKIIRQRKRKEKLFTEEQLWDIFGTLASAVKHLHEKSILHRDIKLENIFLTKDGKVKLGDLGMAKILRNSDQMLSTRVGTPSYFAPEIVQHQLYSFPVDVWSLGCAFYFLTTFEHPFKDATIETLGYYIVDRNPKPIKGQYSAQLIGFIMGMLEKNPNTRPSIFEVALKIRSKNETRSGNRVSVHNVRQLLSMKQVLKREAIDFELSSLQISPRKGSPVKRNQGFYSELKNRYEESLGVMADRFKNRNQSGGRTPSQSPDKDKSPLKSPRKGETFRNFSMTLQKNNKIRPESVPISSPMIKSNGFSQFNRGNSNGISKTRKNSFHQPGTLEKARKEMFPQMPELEKHGFKTARVILRGTVL